MSPTAPARSLDQRMTALNEANRIRIYRAALKREVTAGRLSLARLLDDPDTATMKVIEAVLVLPGVGRAKARRALIAAQCSPSKTFGGLSERQRRDLLIALGRWLPRGAR